MARLIKMDELVSFSKQIEEDVSPIILINKFNARPEYADRFIKAWEKHAIYFRSQPGCISALKEVENAGNIKHIVKLSVMGVHAKPGVTGGRLHRQVEKMIEESGIPFTIFCINFLMQNFVNSLSQTIREQGSF
jgi:NmrA-like family/Antibiotic biosynthesis monooxygenase